MSAGRGFQRLDLQAFALGSGRFSLGASILDAWELEIWRGCAQPRSLVEHAKHIATSYQLEQSEQVRVDWVLQQLLEDGLLRDVPALVPEGAGSSYQAQTIDNLAVLTCDRPGLAKRALEKILRPDEAARLRILVADDADRPITPAGVNMALEHLTRHHRASYCESLPQELREAARFLLLGDRGLGMTTGANLNAVRLACTGSHLLSIDDDIHGPLQCSADQSAADDLRLRICDAMDPTRVMLYPDAATAKGDLFPAESSPLQVHESMLGQPAHELLGRSGNRIAWDILPDTATQLESGGRVLLSSCGVAGDCGMSSPFHHLLLDGEAGQQLAASYSELRLTRQLQRATTCPTLAYGPHFMAGCTGWVGDALLPPSFPLGRIHDSAFGMALHRLYPHCPIAHLPQMLLHSPQEPRGYTEDDLILVSTDFRPGEQLFSAIADWRPHPLEPDPIQRLRSLARHMKVLGEAPGATYRDWLDTAARRVLAVRIQNLDQQLGTVDGDWAEDIEKTLASAEQALLSFSPDACTSAQEQIKAYGNALDAWPDLLAWATQHPLRGEIVPAAT